MKKNVIAILAVGLIFAGLGMYAGLSRWSADIPAQTKGELIEGELIYARSFPKPDGTTESLSKWKGKTLVVNFWATWCPPCIEEMPELSDLQTEITGQNMQIIGIGIDNAENISSFVQKQKVNFPVYIAGMSATDLSRQLGNHAGGLPYTVVLKPDGKIQKVYLGKVKIPELRKELGLK